MNDSPWNYQYDHSIDELELNIRCYRALVNNDIKTVEEVKKKSDAELLRIPNFGRKSLQELKETIALWEIHTESKQWVPAVLPPPLSREAIMLTAVLIEIRDALRLQVTILDRIHVVLEVIMGK